MAHPAPAHIAIKIFFIKIPKQTYPAKVKGSKIVATDAIKNLVNPNMVLS